MGKRLLEPVEAPAPVAPGDRAARAGRDDFFFPHKNTYILKDKFGYIDSINNCAIIINVPPPGG
jgi:hypothetical protein